MQRRKTDEQIKKDRDFLLMLVLASIAGVSFFTSIGFALFGSLSTAAWTAIPAVLIYGGYFVGIYKAIVDDRKNSEVQHG